MRKAIRGDRLADHVRNLSKTWDKVLILPTAVFDEENFVFNRSCADVGPVSAPKNINDTQYWHRDTAANRLHRALLKDEGDEEDEVWQVSHIDGKRIAKSLKALQPRTNI